MWQVWWGTVMLRPIDSVVWVFTSPGQLQYIVFLGKTLINLTLAVRALATKVYKCIPVNLMLGKPAMDYHPIGGKVQVFLFV